MINKICLGNFKAFAETQHIPIKPLTLIFGSNSAGKSSIIHGLILAHEAQRTGNLDVFNTELGGNSVDLGGFQQYVHKREANRRVEWGVEIDASKFKGRLAELLTSVSQVKASLTVGIKTTDYGSPESGALPMVMSYDVEADDEVLLRSSRRGELFRVDRVNTKHPAFRTIIKALVETGTTTESIKNDEIELIQKVIDDIVLQMNLQIGKFLPARISKEKASEDMGGTMLFPIGKASRKEDLASAFRFYFPRIVDELIQGLSQAIQEELGRVNYLGPLRSYPPRHLAFLQDEDRNWFAGGGHAWNIVHKNAEIRSKVNKWLSDRNRLAIPYELRIQHLSKIEALDPSYTDLIKKLEDRFTGDEPYDFDLFGEIYGALDTLKKQEENFSEIQELNLVDCRNNTVVSHRDVGIGVSQVLPVLVAAYASKNKIMAIEQPEIHLHPALQAELGDLFIESALGENKNTFLLETHSEHLILRLMRRLRETHEDKLPKGITPVRSEEVAVLYVDADGPSSIVREMPLNERGELVKAWPGGFFEEGLREVLP